MYAFYFTLLGITERDAVQSKRDNCNSTATMSKYRMSTVSIHTEPLLFLRSIHNEPLLFLRSIHNEPLLFLVGGGVLAHTILGVDFNDQTGDIRFVYAKILLLFCVCKGLKLPG